MDLRAHDQCLAMNTHGDNGISHDSLDVCFGDQLVGSVTVNLCVGVGTRFRLDSSVETLGHSLRFYVLVE